MFMPDYTWVRLLVKCFDIRQIVYALGDIRKKNFLSGLGSHLFEFDMLWMRILKFKLYTK